MMLLSCFFSQEYSKLIPGTTVGTLSTDSGNVIQLIEAAYAVRTVWGGKNEMFKCNPLIPFECVQQLNRKQTHVIDNFM